MKIKIKCLSTKLILVIIIFLENIITKTILIAKGLSKGKYHNDIGGYNFSFNINAVLTGNLSQSMLDKFNIKNNYNDNKLKINCNFPEKKNNVKKEVILINCYINNMIYNNISLYFEGASDNLELINFNEKYLYLENIFCKKEIILILGKIKDEKYKNNNSLFYYDYKIEILNNTIPTELFNNNFDLSPTNLNNNENEYNITCNIVNNDNNYFFNCSLLCYKQINNYIYYDKGNIYKKEINDIIIHIKNINDNLYIGKNVEADFQNKNNISNISLRNMEVYSSDTSTDYNQPDPLPPTEYISNTPTTEFEKTCNSDEFLNTDNECYSCFPLCEKCDSFDHCTKCKNDINYIIQKETSNRCISCFSLYEGCETCNENDKCTNCYNNNIFQFELRNGLCESKQEYNNKEIHLKYKQFDGYKKIDNTIYFNCHFVLLNNYLYKAKLYLYNTIIITNKRILRDLDTKKENITCEQYGDSLGDVNNGYLANFECSLLMDSGEELFSIQPESLEIISKNNKIIIKDFKSEAIEKDFLKAISLDIIYKNSFFSKFSISEISDKKLKDDLTFNIKGEYIKSKDISTNTDSDYNIELKYNDNEIIKATCNFKEEKNDTLSCTIYSSDLKEKETLSFIEDIYDSINTNEKLVLINLNDATIKVPKSTLSIGAIVGITIAGIVLLVPFIYYIVKYYIEKKELNNENEGNGNGIGKQRYQGKLDNSDQYIIK